MWQYATNAVLQSLGQRRQAGLRLSSGELFCQTLHYRTLWRSKCLAQAQSQQPDEVHSRPGSLISSTVLLHCQDLHVATTLTACIAVVILTEWAAWRDHVSRMQALLQRLSSFEAQPWLSAADILQHRAMVEATLGKSPAVQQAEADDQPSTPRHAQPTEGRPPPVLELVADKATAEVRLLRAGKDG